MPSGEDPTRTPAALLRAVAEFAEKAAGLRDAADSLTRGAQRQRESRVADSERRHARDEAATRERMAAEFARARTAAQNAAEELLPEPSAPAGLLDAAEYVGLGIATHAGAGGRADQSVRVPAPVPLLDHGNLVIAGAWDDDVGGLVRSVVRQALERSGPGQVAIRGIDPGLRAVTSAFAPLAKVNEDLLPRPAGTGTDIEQSLAALVDDIRQTVDTFQGRRTTLGELRRQTGQPVGGYQLLVVCDYPQGFSEDAVRSLVSIMRQGPACGISTILQYDPRMRCGGTVDDQSDTLVELGNVVAATSGRFEPGWLPGWTIQPPPAADLAPAVTRIAERAKAAEAPHIDFLELQPRLPLMSDSSAERLVATIGREGHEPIEIVLGDDREQRHNILVSGAVGQGKSNLLMVLVHSLAMRYAPAELEMHLLDFKEGITLEPLGPRPGSRSWLPHARTVGLNSDREYGAAVLAHLVEEFDRRAALIRSYGDDLLKYRRADPSHVLPRIVTVIDEFQVLFEADDEITERALADLERLARKGRAYGMHLVLASQTLSGIISMLAKQDGIFAQFPVRLALKNSPSESRAVLDQENTEASRLRYRGEAVVNLESGSAEANRRATVAWADEARLRSLRERVCARVGDSVAVPVLFDGSAAQRISGAVGRLHELRGRQRAGRAARVALLGTAIDVGVPAVGFALTDDHGRHLAVVGAGDSRYSGAANGGGNQAVGAVQAAAVSLALQHPARDCEFVVLDLLPAETSDTLGVDALERTLTRLGAGVLRLGRTKVDPYLRKLPGMLEERQAGTPGSSLYVIGLGLDRLRLSREFDLSGGGAATPADGLHALLKHGPPVGAHLLAWWSSVRVMNEHVGLEAQDTIDGILGLRISGRDVQDLFGPLVTWNPRGPRGLLHDRTGGEPTTIVPFGPITEDDVRALTAEPWDA
ncbi:hypothetical protein HDA32_004138 [Spinactinospora alkalitolerans]|uniref:FtsK domain-containing protein n=1 Tax=Spinactinospora alkalitolerans TaxID=687207 RepID=A0A852TYK9_9ACTN|nr:FtsK/SpoIIIE domain-containing protein [Spinactinospora alkalitolerans]NYE49018.1 hypothetical protein [Spinactinospora alkalitolerans]